MKACRPMPSLTESLWAAHRLQPSLESPMVTFQRIVRVLLGDVNSRRQEFSDDRSKSRGRSVVTSSGSSWTAEHSDKEPSCGGDIPPGRHQNVDDLAVRVDRPVYVSPHTSDLHIRVVDEPADTGCVSLRADGLDGQTGEVLDPAVQRDMVDLDSTPREQLLDIPVRPPKRRYRRTASKITSDGNR